MTIVPIADRHHEMANKLDQLLKENSIRTKLDDRSETIKYRIREAQEEQIPYMVVIGDKEVENNSISIRHRRLGDLGSMPVDQFIAQVKDEVSRRVLDSLENKVENKQT